tara:strand:- start:52504 stop:54888 length:2385 start_codon:yes stop_codon:yes gene_type:complete
MNVAQLLRPRAAGLLLSSVFLGLGLPLSAQCQLAWQSGAGASGVAGASWSLASMANGDIAICGEFLLAGDVLANNVVRYDGSNFHALGDGVTGTVFASAVLPNGDLIVGGQFGSAGGSTANNVARWDGVTWSPMSTGTNGRVLSLAALPNGDVVAAGLFGFAGGVPCNQLARWDGSSWSPLGTHSFSSVRTIEVDANGDLLAGGQSAISRVQRWNGTSWSSLPGVVASELVSPADMVFLPNGDLVMVGNTTEGVLQVWDGSQLTTLQPPVAGAVSLGVAANGDLLVGRSNLYAQGAAMLRFDGSTWTIISGMGGSVWSIAADNAGNTFAARGTFLVRAGLLRLVGNSVVPVTVAPESADVDAIVAAQDGDVFVGGVFAEIAGIAANNIARWDGSTYQALGLGVDDAVTAIAQDPNGDLIVGGSFLGAGGTPATRIARWNGTTWSAIGAGLVGVPRHVAVNASGEIAVVLSNSTSNTLQVFDGQSWSTLALAGGLVHDLIALPNGDFVIGGRLSAPTANPLWIGGYVLSGGSLTPLVGFDYHTITAMTLAPDGALLVARQVPWTELVRVFPGGATQVVYTAVGVVPLSVLQYLPNGDLVSNAFDAGGIARLVGNAWVPIDGGVTGGGVTDIAFGKRGELFAIGDFDLAGAEISVSVAHAESNCPAAVASVGTGCSGSAGSVDLTTNDLPWLGSKVVSATTGMTASSLAVQVVGVQGLNVPLPLGAAGCSLLVDPLALELLIPSGGVVPGEFRVPNNVGLLGRTLLLQVVGVELGATFSLHQTTSSNALQLTVGAF